MKPITPHDKNRMIEALDILREIIEDAPEEHTCLICQNYKDGHCKAFDMRPPADFVAQANDCDQWRFDPSSPPF